MLDLEINSIAKGAGKSKLEDCQGRWVVVVVKNARPTCGYLNAISGLPLKLGT